MVKMGLEILGDDSKCIEAALMNTRISVGNGNLGNTKKRWEYDHKNMEFISNLPYSAELAYPYTLIMESAFWLDRDFESAMKWTEELEKKAKQHNDLSATALAWHYYGDFLKDIGDYKGAIYQYSRSIPAFESIGDDRYLSWGHWEMGHLLFALGEIDKAKIHYGTWLKIKERMGNQREIGYANEALGNVSVCQHLWDDAITYYKKYAEAFRIVKNPGEVTKSYLHIGNTYLRKGEYNQAIHYIEAGLNEAMSVPPELRDNVWLAGLIFRALSYMEESYKFLGTQEKFIDFCISFEGIYADILDVLPFQHWYLKLEEPSKKFTNPIFKDDFQQGKIDPTWVWIDKFNDCLYNPAIPGGLEIHAVNGRGLHLLRGVNASAPRLMREFSGDFAVETCISSCDEKPQIGGLLVWKDINNFLKFEKGFRGTGAICTEGILEGKWHFIGRGAMSGSRSEKVYLRMERYNDRFSSFCSSDGEKWMSCGHVDFAADGPVQIGIFASSIIDRTIYCGEYKEGTATLFHNFRIWTE